MPVLKFNVFDLMPRSATHYVLPAMELPVIHKRVEIGRTNVNERGEFEFESIDGLASDINTGDAIVLPTSRVTTLADGVPRLQLTSVEIHSMEDTFK